MRYRIVFSPFFFFCARSHFDFVFLFILGSTSSFKFFFFSLSPSFEKLFLFLLSLFLSLFLFPFLSFFPSFLFSFFLSPYVHNQGIIVEAYKRASLQMPLFIIIALGKVSCHSSGNAAIYHLFRF